MNLPIACGFLFLWGILVLAALLAWATAKAFPAPELKQVQLRIKTWFYILTVFCSVFFLPAYYAAALLFLLGLLALREIWKTFFSFPTKSVKIVTLAGGLSGLVLLSLISAFYLYESNLSVFFLVVVVTQLNDIFQYLWGKSLGKKLIVPRISPTKTWVGFWGGVITSGLLACWTAPYFVEIDRICALIVGLIIGCLGFLGDITVSFFKRQCTIKDFGAFLPGHGGLLDRIDSLLYVLPVIVYFL